MRAPSRARLCASVVCTLWFFAFAQGAGAQTRVKVQAGHNRGVQGVAFSSDGRLMASGGLAPVVKLWDLQSGKLVRDLTGHSEPVTGVAVSPDGRHVLSSAGVLVPMGIGGPSLRNATRGEVILWDAATGRKIRALHDHASGQASAVAFSPDGRRALTGVIYPARVMEEENVAREGKTIHLWEIPSGKLVKRFDTEDGVHALGFSPDGRHAFAIVDASHNGGSGALLLFDATTGARLHQLGQDANVTCAGFSTDGTILHATNGMFAVPGGRRLGPSHGCPSPDGRALVKDPTGHGSRTVEIVDATLGTLLGKVSIVAGDFAAVAPDGKSLVAELHDDQIGGTGEIGVWSIASGARRTVLGAGARPVSTIAILPDGTLVAGSWPRWGEKGAGLVWDIDALRSRGAIAGFPASFAASADGKRIFGMASDGTQALELWNGETGQRLERLEQPSPTDDVAIAANGSAALFAYRDGYTVGASLWRPGSKPIPLGGIANRLDALDPVVAAVSPDGQHAALGGASTGILLWDTNDPSRLARELPALQSHPFALAFSPDGQRLAVGDFDGRISVATLRSGRYEQTLRLGETVLSVRFSPDGKLVAAGGAKGRVAVWDDKGKALHAFDSETLAVNDLVFSREGRLLHAAGSDGSLRALDLAQGERFALVAHERDWVVFTDDGLFDASREGHRLVAMVQGSRGFSIEQVALSHNRPDRILTRFGLGTPAQIAHYESRFRRRLARAGIDERALEASVRLPTATINRFEVQGKHVALSLSFDGAGEALTRYHVFVNDVAIHGMAGKPISGATIEERLELTAGRNLIEVSATNAAGAESRRDAVVVEGPASTGSLFVLAVGVSKHRVAAPDLRYAAKDALDLSHVLRAARGYARVEIETLTDTEATADAIRARKAFFARAGVDDTVVLFVAGHGHYARDDAATYYFVSHDADPRDMDSTALRFEELEQLLDGIAPRRKLFLLDTCYSGEIDPGLPPAGPTLTARARAARPLSLAEGPPPSAAPARTFLFDHDRFIESDIRRRTGAIVLSSSLGGEVSYEDPVKENGEFTSAVLDALTTDVADRDGDGLLSIAELRDHVLVAVPKATGGHQHPTVDRDNLSQRFSLPIVTGVGRSAGPVASEALSPRAPSATLPPGSGGCACTLAQPATATPWIVFLAALVPLLRRRNLGNDPPGDESWPGSRTRARRSGPAADSRATRAG